MGAGACGPRQHSDSDSHDYLALLRRALVDVERNMRHHKPVLIIDSERTAVFVQHDKCTYFLLKKFGWSGESGQLQ